MQVANLQHAFNVLDIKIESSDDNDDEPPTKGQMATELSPVGPPQQVIHGVAGSEPIESGSVAPGSMKTEVMKRPNTSTDLVLFHAENVGYPSSPS